METLEGKVATLLLAIHRMRHKSDAMLLLLLCPFMDLITFIYAFVLTQTDQNAVIVIALMEKMYFEKDDNMKHMIVILSIYQCILKGMIGGFGWLSLRQDQNVNIKWIIRYRYFYVIIIEGFIIGVIIVNICNFYKFQMYQTTFISGLFLMVFEILYFTVLMYLYADRTPIHQMGLSHFICTILPGFYMTMLVGPLSWILLVCVILYAPWSSIFGSMVAFLMDLIWL